MPRINALQVNGSSYPIDAETDRSLLSVLRDDLGLTGAKYGCGEARCGACTVLVDGEPVRSCITRVGALARKSIRTIEGLALGDVLHPVQEAFLDAEALQCGYCTPGMIMASVALLEKNAAPAEGEIKRALEGNICRCGTYARILKAVLRAAELAKGGTP